MKTIKQFLEELPEPYRTKAINSITRSLLKDYRDDLLQSIGAVYVNGYNTDEYYNIHHLISMYILRNGKF